MQKLQLITFDATCPNTTFKEILQYTNQKSDGTYPFVVHLLLSQTVFSHYQHSSSVKSLTLVK